MDLVEWLKEKEHSVYLLDAPVIRDMLRLWQPSWIVSFNYTHIIPAEVIALARGRIINLHISLLPYNRGASPNFFSFMDNTPKGVTIHLMDEGLDTGDILCQKALTFDENEETFAHTYQMLIKEITQLFKENWDKIKRGELPARKQDEALATYHTIKELKRFQEYTAFSWDEKIKDIKNKWERWKQETI